MTNKITSKGLIRAVLIVAIVFFSGNYLKGQQLKKMGNGLTKNPDCSCTDSIGNVYVAISYSDTTIIQKWNVSAKSWSVYARLLKFSPGYHGTCNFLKGKFYLVGANANSGKTELMSFNGSSWNFIARFNYVDYSKGISSIKFNNQLYFVGGFDSVGFNKMPNVAVFDGSTFSAAGFPVSTYTSAGYFESSLSILSDSLFLTSKSRIILHKAPNTWVTYYTHPTSKWISSISVKGNLLYASVSGEILILANGLKIDSFKLRDFNRGNLKTARNQLFIAETGGGSGYMYHVRNRKDARFLFKNEFYDSSNRSMVTDNNRLYYHASEGVKVNGVDYLNIAEIRTDTINSTGFDTITGYVYWDKNDNYKKDGNDAWAKNGLMINVSDGYYISLKNNTGSFEDIVLGNKSAEYQLSSATFDSCVQFNFSGNIKSRNADTGIFRDTLYFPLVRPTYKTLNYVLRSICNSRARMMDTIPLTINVRNRDCYSVNTNNASIKVTLDTGTVFVSSVPAYTSKAGNVYTYSGLTLKFNSDNFIKMTVMYPITNYNAGHTVRHYARLANIAGEDTMDNLDSFVQKLVYSYDPNAKHSVPEGKITKDLKSIRYYIDFQNEGNDDAVKVTIIDTLDLKMPVYGFQMVANSHSYKASVTPGTGIVTWVFDNINLKPKAQNEAASKGFIIFDAKVRTNVKIGDSIRNRAYIYFDYNKPIVTNYAVINRVDPKIDVHTIINRQTTSLKVYPNPAQNFITIENSISSSQSIDIYDIKGARISTFQLNGKEAMTIRTENWAKGLYIVVNSKGESFKLVIE